MFSYRSAAVESEGQAGPVDEEALVPGGMARRTDGPETGQDFGVSVEEAPVDARVVEVDAEYPVFLRSRMGGAQSVGQLLSLDSHRHPGPGEVPQASGMVVVQVTEAHQDDVAEGNAHGPARLLQRVAGTGRQDGGDAAAVEPPAQGRVSHQGGVEPGVQQGPPVVELDEHGGHGSTRISFSGPPRTETALGSTSQPSNRGTTVPGTPAYDPAPAPPLGKWPLLTSVAKTSQITRTPSRAVISALS